MEALWRCGHSRTPENTAWGPRCKQCQKVNQHRYNQTTKGRASKLRHLKTDKGRASYRRYQQSAKGRAAKLAKSRRFHQTEKGRAKRARDNAKRIFTLSDYRGMAKTIEQAEAIQDRIQQRLADFRAKQQAQTEAFRENPHNLPEIERLLPGGL